MRSLFYILFIPLIFFSCEDFFVQECFTGEAKLVRREIPFDSIISRLYVMSEAELYLSNGEQKVEVEFPENLIEDLNFDFRRGDLTITNDVTCKWRKENYAPKLYISVPDAKRIHVIDYAKIFCLDTLEYNRIKFYTNGTGDLNLLVDANNLSIQGDYVAEITVAGKADLLVIYFKNLGRLHAQDLISKEIRLKHYGENSLFINPTEKLTAQLFNIGNVYTTNIPEDSEIIEQGTGKVIVQ